MKVNRLSDHHAGVEVIGLEPSLLEDQGIRQQLYDLWVWEGLVVFRAQADTDFHLNLSRVFGELEHHPVRESWVEGHPDLINVRYTPENGTIYVVNGKTLGGYLPWHTDLIYVDKINHGGILRPIQNAPSGGDTGFIDQIGAYERLPQKLKDEIEDLAVVYKMNFFAEEMRFGRAPDSRIRSGLPTMRLMERTKDFPRVVHPMVFTQPETGRKVLNVSPWFAVGIHGRENDAGDALLREVSEYCTDERYAYYHHWNADDMVLWDNWRMLHSACGVEPDSTRWMQRTTIKGDYALGRLESANAEIDQSLVMDI